MTTELTAEINELRNQVRTLKRMLFGVFGLVVVGGLLAASSLQSVPDVIQAKNIEVVNEDGEAQILLKSSGGTEGPCIQINDSEGTKRFWIGSQEDGESRFEHWDFETSDRSSVLRIVSSIDIDNVAMSQFNDEADRERVSIGTTRNDENDKAGYLSFMDKEERSRVWIGTIDSGWSQIIQTDANGARRIWDFTTGESSKDGAQEIESDFLAGSWYADPYHKSRLWIGTDRGATGISLYDWYNNARIGFQTGYGGTARMYLLDGEGNESWMKTSQGEVGDFTEDGD